MGIDRRGYEDGELIRSIPSGGPGQMMWEGCGGKGFAALGGQEGPAWGGGTGCGLALESDLVCSFSFFFLEF